MLANETRRPYPHPYEVRSPSVRHVLPPSAGPDTDDTQTASIPRQTIPLQNPLQSIPTQAAADGGAPPQTPPELTARTVHRLRHIRQVSDQAISVIDQALHHVP
ncbi:hypothetical protein [Nonomuraea sp. NEAU-A123]|uniref:hypothetical protein n=1 Tax=Nonomuraea sp. NEAU-A123 TaxID=2839649 RepID=UPI001BE45BB8|nr:hypothetical protein [Nonomuraea sp. NEAU-A123]MBT2226896.1 hypothetical protein [Nonomuraea sp. NEAU-A123]